MSKYKHSSNIHQTFTRVVLFMPLIFILTSCGILDNTNETNVSSTLVNYLYPGDNAKQKVEGLQQSSSTPQITLPVRVGIAFVPGGNYRASPLNSKTQTELLNKAKEKFSTYPFIKHIEVIPSSYLQSRGGFSNLSQVARMYDVDLMALVSYDQIQKNYQRDSSFLYLTIVGAYVMKGDVNQTQTFVDTAVFDVASQKLLFSAPGIDQNSRHSTAIKKGETQTKLALNGFNSAVDDMLINLDTELSMFRERVKNEKIVDVKYAANYSGGGSFGYLFILYLALMGLMFRRVN